MKVKINKLPEGYKVKGGKIVKMMSTGGAPYNNSIGSIPEEFANLEAEKGETALTDLTQDGNFELYNIGGKRHQDGGTNLSLPPQSFIFSDTAKMKLNKAQLQTFGITSKKKMSPAAVSKKFPLNKYYSALDNEFVDSIGTTTAELMLAKNKMKLSQLAFVSESKKKFEDGLPLAAYPYLMSKDIDPIEFVQKVNKLNEEQAQMQMIDQLPPEEQQQILALQDFTGGQGGPPQGGPQGGMPPQQMMAMMGQEKYEVEGDIPQTRTPANYYARYGGGLPKAQSQIETASIYDIPNKDGAYSDQSWFTKANHGFSEGMYNDAQRMNTNIVPGFGAIGKIQKTGKLFDYAKKGVNAISDWWSGDEEIAGPPEGTQIMNIAKNGGGLHKAQSDYEVGLQYDPLIRCGPGRSCTQGGNPLSITPTGSASFSPSASRFNTNLGLGLQYNPSIEAGGLEGNLQYNRKNSWDIDMGGKFHDNNTEITSNAATDNLSLKTGWGRQSPWKPTIKYGVQGNFNLTDQQLDNIGLYGQYKNYGANINYNPQDGSVMIGGKLYFKTGGGLPKAQGGGEEMQQIMQMVGQAMEQGAQPEEVIAELLQNQIPPEVVMQVFGQLGMPPEQVEQMIMAVMQQVQGGQQQQMMPPQGPPQGGMPPEMMMAMQQGQGQPPMKYGGIFKAQSQQPGAMHLPSQRLQEVADITPFDASAFTNSYPEISYGRDINQGVNQGSLVALAEQLIGEQNAIPDPMYDGRYKDDPQADYAKEGGMIRAGAYNGRSPHFSLDNMIPAGAYNNPGPLGKFVYGGEEYIDRYTDYDMPKFQNDGELMSAYATRMGQTWDPKYKDATYNKSTKMWVYSDGTPSVSNKDFRKNAMNPDFVPPAEYFVEEKSEEVINENNGETDATEEEVKTYHGQGGYDKMMNLYNSEDFDMINDYSFEVYQKMYKQGYSKNMGPEMSAEEFEAVFLADQKWKALLNDPEVVKNLSITLANGDIVTGEEALRHDQWDDGTNGMYRQVYEKLMVDYPEASLPPLPEDDAELKALIGQGQSTFMSFGGLQKESEKRAANGDPSMQKMLKNVNISATGVANEGGMGEKAWSTIDGLAGNTWLGQSVGFANQDKEIIEKAASCYYDKNQQPIAASVAAETACQQREGTYDRDVCQCVEKTELKIPSKVPKEFWKQDIMKIDALAGVDINKLYPSRQSFSGNFADPAYKDPTREIAAIGEQATIAGDLAAQNLSGPGLAAVLSKIQGAAGSQISNALDKVQNDNISIYNQADTFNAGVQTNTDVLNQDAGKTYMDAVNLVDQNYDNAKNELNIELADAHANAWTNRANTYNLNTLTPNYNIDPTTGGIIDITNEKDFYAQNVNDPKSGMDVRMGMWEDCMAKCQGPTETDEGRTACKEECNKMVQDELKRNSGNNSTLANNGNPISGGYPGGSDNTVNKTEEDIKSSYGRELRRELIMRRGGQW